jgi:hypothetical protein
MVRRTGTITVDPRLWPKSPTDLLAPYGSVVQVERGVVIPGVKEPEWVPVGLFSLDESSRTRDAGSRSEVSVKLVDAAARVADDRFDAPVQTTRGATAQSEIIRLVRETLGLSYPVIDLTTSSTPAAVIEIDRERWKDGIEKLADSIAAEVFFDPQGVLVIRPQPTLGSDYVWQVKTGPGGNMLTRKDVMTRDKVFNRFVASGQRSDGTPPVRGVAIDSDPNSATRYGGPFGKKPRFYSSALLTTVAQCEETAAAYLARIKGIAAQVDLDAIVNPALDVGDVILVVDDGVITRHIIDRLTIPLGADGVQQITTRSDDLPAES